MTSSQDNKSTEFLDLCTNNGLNQLVEEPTRLGNILELDLLLCNDSALVSDVKVGVPFGTSDHNSITFSIVTVGGGAELNIEPTQILSWHKMDWNNFAVYCQNYNWYRY